MPDLCWIGLLVGSVITGLPALCMCHSMVCSREEGIHA